MEVATVRCRSASRLACAAAALLALLAVLLVADAAFALPKYTQKCSEHCADCGGDPACLVDCRQGCIDAPPPSGPGCLTCHLDGEGGRGCPDPPCLNPFGEAFADNGHRWDIALATVDHDADGYTSGEELGDRDGDGVREGTRLRSSPGMRLPPDENECFLDPRHCAVGEICRKRVTEERPYYECSIPEHGNATPLRDGVWAPIDTTRVVGQIHPSRCDSAGVGQWFFYPMECGGEGAFATIEAPGFQIAAYDPYDLLREEVSESTEHACGPGTGVTVYRSVLIRAFSRGRTVGRIRATCMAGLPSPPPGEGVLHADVHPTCDRAALVVDGVVDVGNTSRSPGHEPLLPTPPWCGPALPTQDLWVRYRAGCTGEMKALATFTASPRSGQADGALSAYGVGDCPELALPLGCQVIEATEGGPVELAVPVLAGDEVVLRVSGEFADETLELSCKPSPHDCSLCAVNAVCRESESPVCSCPAGLVGDGRRTHLGGTGCRPDPAPCVERGLECDPNGECDPERGCVCDEGYQSIGLRCVDALECPGTCFPAGARSVRCFEADHGPVCGCDLGHSPDPTAPVFSCRVHCGDGLRGPRERCDDGNLDDGDGCNRNCEPERLNRCRDMLPSEGPSICENTCGDGLIDREAGERCDDGNRLPGDGCGPLCLQELVLCSARPGVATGLGNTWLLALSSAWIAVRRFRRRREA